MQAGVIYNLHCFLDHHLFLLINESVSHIKSSRSSSFFRYFNWDNALLEYLIISLLASSSTPSLQYNSLNFGISSCLIPLRLITLRNAFLSFPFGFSTDRKSTRLNSS